MRRRPEHGAAMLVTMILIAALLSGAAALAHMQMTSTRGAELTKVSSAAGYCAEAGLATARAAVATNYTQWNAALAAGTEPSWLASLSHDLDGDGANDFVLSLRDNDDETTTTADPTTDNDLVVYVVSTCVKYPEAPRTVAELVRYTGGGNCYQSQLGGCGGNNNAN